MMGTDKEYLFNSLDEDITDLNTLRIKSLYKLDQFYFDLAEFINKKSFEEKREINN